MDIPLSMTELDIKLCKFCIATDFGLRKVNTGPHDLCEGRFCEEAYSNYLEDFQSKKDDVE